MPTNGDMLPALWQYRVATLKQYFWMKGNSCNCCDDVLTTGKFLTTSALSETSHSCSSLSLTSLQKQVGATEWLPWLHWWDSGYWRVWKTMSCESLLAHSTFQVWKYSFKPSGSRMIMCFIHVFYNLWKYSDVLKLLFLLYTKLESDSLNRWCTAWTWAWVA